MINFPVQFLFHRNGRQQISLLDKRPQFYLGMKTSKDHVVQNNCCAVKLYPRYGAHWCNFSSSVCCELLLRISAGCLKGAILDCSTQCHGV